MTQSVEIGALDADRLRDLAMEATAGPWTAEALGSEGYAVRGPSAPVAGTRGVQRRPWLARCGWEKWETDRANAEFIAACDPATILTLLDRLDRAERRNPPDRRAE